MSVGLGTEERSQGTNRCVTEDQMKLLREFRNWGVEETPQGVQGERVGPTDTREGEYGIRGSLELRMKEGDRLDGKIETV